MKPIETTGRDVPGHTHTFAARHGRPTDRVSPAGAAAIDRIEMPMN